MKALLVAGILAMLVGFQNCAPTEFVADAKSTETITALPAPGEPTGQSPTENPAPKTATPTPACVQAGTKLFASSTFIYYRNCDGERERWIQLGQRQCCSGQVTIVDVESYVDPQCADGRFAGAAYCE